MLTVQVHGFIKLFTDYSYFCTWNTAGAKAAKDSVKDLKKADEEEVKTTDKDLGTSVEKEMGTSATDLVVPADKHGKDEKAFVEGPTSSELEPGKWLSRMGAHFYAFAFLLKSILLLHLETLSFIISSCTQKFTLPLAKL